MHNIVTPELGMEACHEDFGQGSKIVGGANFSQNYSGSIFCVT